MLSFLLFYYLAITILMVGALRGVTSRDPDISTSSSWIVSGIVGVFWTLALPLACILLISDKDMANKVAGGT